VDNEEDVKMQKALAGPAGNRQLVTAKLDRRALA
jgi:hypothetical protein